MRLSIPDDPSMKEAPEVVLNKPRASMVLGTNQMARSKKDGYTIAYTNTSAIV
jgi:hypothetical protein